jgi:peptide/nickel transport system permease protein
VIASTSQRAGWVMLGLLAFGALAAPLTTPHNPATQFADHVKAPPMPPRVVDAAGQWRRPFVYPVVLTNRLEGIYAEDRTRMMPLRWFDGSLVWADETAGLWLPLGGDALGRDVFARVITGARLSLGVALAATAAALLIGGIVGALAGFAGGRVDELLMRMTDFVLVLPAVYVVLMLRAAMPLVLSTTQVFWTISLVLAIAGWPMPARGVRAIVATEKRKEYAEAAAALGAGSSRILLRHLLPATGGFLAVQATLLAPAFILAEATLSFVGFGFADPAASWGLMLQDAAAVSTIADAPWMLAPGAAIVLTVFALHAVSSSGSRSPLGSL